MKLKIMITILVLGLMVVGVVGAGVLPSLTAKDETFVSQLPSVEKDFLLPMVNQTTFTNFAIDESDGGYGELCIEFYDYGKSCSKEYLWFNKTVEIGFKETDEQFLMRRIKEVTDEKLHNIYLHNIPEEKTDVDIGIKTGKLN